MTAVGGNTSLTHEDLAATDAATCRYHLSDVATRMACAGPNGKNARHFPGPSCLHQTWS